jgi:hypothetical protein
MYPSAAHIATAADLLDIALESMQGVVPSIIDMRSVASCWWHPLLLQTAYNKFRPYFMEDIQDFATKALHTAAVGMCTFLCFGSDDAVRSSLGAWFSLVGCIIRDGPLCVSQGDATPRHPWTHWVVAMDGSQVLADTGMWVWLHTVRHAGVDVVGYLRREKELARQYCFEPGIREWTDRTLDRHILLFSSGGDPGAPGEPPGMFGYISPEGHAYELLQELRATELTALIRE